MLKNKEKIVASFFWGCVISQLIEISILKFGVVMSFKEVIDLMQVIISAIGLLFVVYGYYRWKIQTTWDKKEDHYLRIVLISKNMKNIIYKMRCDLTLEASEDYQKEFDSYITNYKLSKESYTRDLIRPFFIRSKFESEIIEFYKIIEMLELGYVVSDVILEKFYKIDGILKQIINSANKINILNIKKGSIERKNELTGNHGLGGLLSKNKDKVSEEIKKLNDEIEDLEKIILNHKDQMHNGENQLDIELNGYVDEIKSEIMKIIKKIY